MRNIANMEAQVPLEREVVQSSLLSLESRLIQIETIQIGQTDMIRRIVDERIDRVLRAISAAPDALESSLRSNNNSNSGGGGSSSSSGGGSSSSSSRTTLLLLIYIYIYIYIY